MQRQDRFSPVAPARPAAIYVDDVVGWSERLDLRPADSDANVWLLEPYGDVVFDRTASREGVVCVNPTQLAVEALAPHLDSIVLVGAQAMYLHTGAADIVVAEFTTDADFAPSDHSTRPTIAA